MFVIAYSVGVICVLLSQLLLAVAFVGIGLLGRRVFGLTKVTLEDCFTAFWMGFGTVILVLMLWHFLLPVNVAALLLVLGLGTVGVFMARGTLRQVLQGAEWRWSRPWLGVFALAALYVANQGLGSLTYADTALYHLQGVVWNKSFPLVPGLANLYGFLGFNNASLLYGAMLDVGPWAGLGHRLANGLLLQVLLLRVLVALARLTTGAQRARAHEVFLVTYLPALLSLSLLGRVSSYATATTAALLVLVVAERLYALLANYPRDNGDAAYAALSITTLSVLAVTLKLSAAIFAASAALLGLIVWIRRRSRTDGMLRRTLAWTLGAGLLIGGSWMVRSVVLSGYPLFPSRALAAPVDWRTSEEHADAEYALAEHSSKASTMLNEVVAGRDRWGWLPRWFKINLRDPFDFLVPTLIALGALLFAIVRRKQIPVEAPPKERPILMLIPLGIAIVAWFLLAPEGRYAIGFFWGLAALAVAELYRTGQARLSDRRVALLLGAAATAVITLVTVPLLHIPFESPGSIGKTLIKSSVKLWDSRGWYEPLQPPPLTPFKTASGLVVGVPSDRCWNAPVPCTPNPSETLELREPGNVRAGFRVRGAWAMQDWPFKSRPAFLHAWRESRVR